MRLLSTPPIRVGVIGLGRRGLFLLERWVDGTAIRVESACDRDPAARAAAATLCGRIVDDPKLLLSDSAVDAVLLAVPVAARGSLGRQVLATGKGLVLIDPPVAPTLDEAVSLFVQARHLNLGVGVWSPWREEAAFRAALATSRCGSTGPLRFLRFEHWEATLGRPRRDDALPRPLVSVLDQLVALASSGAERVYVAGRIDGVVTVTVEFQHDLHASIVLGTGAAMRLDSGWAFDAEQGGFAAGRRWVRTGEGEVYDVPVEPLRPTSIEDVIQSVIERSPPAEAVESLRLIALLAAVERSLRSRAVVEVERVE